MSVDGNPKPIHVFVHLARGYGAGNWQRRWAAGQILGVNERLAYGYFHAAEDGCSVVYSEDIEEKRFQKLFRLGVRAVIGLDFVHAWRNRKGLFESDVVWTHTELQSLVILLLFQILFWTRRPKLIAQSVWLFDRWQSFGLMRRWIFVGLLSKADILTVLSPENLKVARAAFPKVRSELVLFGINADSFAPLKNRPIGRPIRILSLGNDEHRDWPTLIRAVKALPDVYLKIASHRVSDRQISDCVNIEIPKIASNEQLFEAFDWADLVVLALKPNLHASGITVLQEAALQGVPVICSDTGGLRAYFSDDEVYFIPPQDSSAIQKAIAKLAGNDDLRLRFAARAQARMRTGGLNSRSYARRHAEISRELLSLSGK